VTRRFRFARLFYRTTWGIWRFACRLRPAGRRRENLLGIFGPLSLLGLFTSWVIVLVFGFALMQWGGGFLGRENSQDFRQCLYHSGETFFTLGYGDITPTTYPGKLIAVLEAGLGFGFMAMIIGYLPVLYQAFSRREQSIALLDARAGSPPTASELMGRCGKSTSSAEMEKLLAEWEVWAAELLESHLSFPVLSFYRSQHDNQSWVAALAVVLDAASWTIVTGNEQTRRRAELTFAMARHACVDLCLVFWLPPVEPSRTRLSADELDSLIKQQGSNGQTDEDIVRRLSEMRTLYEPFLQTLSNFFCFPLPRYFPDRVAPDNWQTTAWTKRAPGITELARFAPDADEHFG
jgi:hypothetical protein